MKEETKQNRKLLLSELRSGKYKKGCMKSDNITGKPIIESPEDNDGCCVCGLMVELFPKPNGVHNFVYAKKQLGVSNKQCRHIQQDLNDTKLSFNEIADIIEKEIF